MSVSMDVYLPVFTQNTITEAVAVLASKKVKLEFHEDDKSDDPNSWSGFQPIVVTIGGLFHSLIISQRFETGFEIDVEQFAIGRQRLAWLDNRPELKQKLEKCSTVVRVTISNDLPMGFAIANCFVAALAEAGNGIAIDGQSDEFDEKLQTVASVLESDLVGQLDEINDLNARESPWLSDGE